MCPKGLNPSVAKPNLKLHGSAAKGICTSSKCCHAFPSTGCLMTFFSTTLLSLRHRLCSDISLEEKIFGTVGLSESNKGSCEEPFSSDPGISTLNDHTRDNEYCWHGLPKTNCSHTYIHQLSNNPYQFHKELS